MRTFNCHCLVLFSAIVALNFFTLPVLVIPSQLSFYQCYAFQKYSYPRFSRQLESDKIFMEQWNMVTINNDHKIV